MKIIAMFLLVIASSLAANAKDYVPIIPNDTAFFTGSNGQILAVRIDSIKTIDNHTYYILNRTWNTEDYNCIKPTGPSWLGPHLMEQSDSVYLFFNNNNDTISIKPLTPVNSSFKLFNYSNGDYIQATVSSITFTQFLGLSDSVKHFTLEHFNRKGQIIADNITDQIFSISKNYGFVKIFSMLEFPEIDSNFTLSGKTNPQAGKTFLTPNEIFDFEIGDGFHSIYSYSEAFWGFRYHEKISKVIDKKLTLNYDTVIYTFSIITFLSESTPEHPDKKDTIYESIAIEKYQLNQFLFIPFEPITDENQYYGIYGMCYYYKNTNMNNRRLLIPDTDWYQNELNDSCWEFVHYDPGLYETYLEGCGLFVSHVYPFGNTLSDDYQLVYYKKGDEIRGTPLTITSVEDNKSVDSFNYFPNPAKRDELITIKNPTPISKIKIIDILGNERISLTAGYQNEIKLKLNNLEPGLYFIILFDTGNNIISDKLIVE